jgi:hypothetical protein
MSAYARIMKTMQLDKDFRSSARITSVLEATDVTENVNHCKSRPGLCTQIIVAMCNCTTSRHMTQQT